jgi:hypothetical protein
MKTLSKRNAILTLVLTLVLTSGGCLSWIKDSDVADLRATVDDLVVAVDDWQSSAADLYDPCEYAKIAPVTDEVKVRLGEISTTLARLESDPNDAEIMIDAAIGWVRGMGAAGLPWAGIVIAGLLGLKTILRARRRKTQPADPDPPRPDII